MSIRLLDENRRCRFCNLRILKIAVHGPRFKILYWFIIHQTWHRSGWVKTSRPSGRKSSSHPQVQISIHLNPGFCCQNATCHTPIWDPWRLASSQNCPRWYEKFKIECVNSSFNKIYSKRLFLQPGILKIARAFLGIWLRDCRFRSRPVFSASGLSPFCL